MQRIFIALLILPFLIGCSEKPAVDMSDITYRKMPSSTTDEQLAEELKVLTNLKELNLFETEITDEGLVHLKGLTKLETLNLGYTKITDAGVKSLQKSLPGCKIKH